MLGTLNSGTDQAEGLRRVLNRHMALAVPAAYRLLGPARGGKTACAMNIGAVLDAQGVPLRMVDNEVAPSDEHEVLLVLCPGIDAITRAYALLKREALMHGRRRFAAVVNRVRDAAGARVVFENVSGAAQRFLRSELTYAGYVREEPALWRGPRILAHYAADAPALADYTRVAQTLACLRTGASDDPVPAHSTPQVSNVWMDPHSDLFQQRRAG